MKKLTQYAVMALIVFVLAASVNAWDVQVTNSCDKTVNVYIYGEHLFWRSIDCKIKGIKPGETKKCTLPGAICPVSIWGDYVVEVAGGTEVFTTPDINFHSSGMACCWNVSARIVQQSKLQCKIKIE